MNKTASEAVDLIEEIKSSVGDQTSVQVCVCPPFTSLSQSSESVEKSEVLLGAQDMNAAQSGAYTGEISAEMLRDLYVSFVILGHSERRQFFGETNQIVNQKIHAAIGNNLKPIYDAMDGDSFLGEIIKEYFIKVKPGSEISSLTVTDTDIPKANEYKSIGINEPFIEINDTAQIELPVNPFVLPSGNLTQNEIKQNTVYFLHSGRRSASGTTSSISGHWDIVVPAVIHDFIKTRTQGYTKKHEKWIQAFVDSHHEIMEDILSPRKGNHWMWHVFPSEIPGRSDRTKIDMDSASYDELFHSRSFYIGFLSTWCNILKQIAEKMENDKTLMKDTWLHDSIDRIRVEDCYSKYEDWFLTKFKPRNTKNIFAIKARFYLAYIYKCVTQGRNAGAIPRPR